MAFPKTQNLDYYRGDTFEFKVYPKTQDGDTFSLTDFETVAFKIANQRGAAGTQYSGEAFKGNDAEGDYVQCKITPTVGRQLSAGQYVYDVQITNSPDIYTIVTGIITVTDDITGAV